jgi:ATP-binding cassette, subfamily C, bacterial LapB
MAATLSISFLPVRRWDAIVASLTLNILALALPLALLHVYDRIIPHESYSTLFLLTLGVLLALLCETWLRLARATLMAWSGARFEHTVGIQALRHLLGSDLRSAEKEGPGALLQRLTSIDKVHEHRAGESAMAMADAPFIFFFLAVMAYIAFPLAVVSMVMLLLSTLCALTFARYTRAIVKERTDVDERRFNFLLECIRAIEVIKSNAIEALMQRRYDRLMGTSAMAAYNTAYLAHVSQNIGGIMSQITTFAVAAAGTLLVIEQKLSYGGLAAAIILSGRIVQPVFRLQLLWSQQEQAKLSEEQLEGIFSLPQQPQGTESIEDLESIELRGVALKSLHHDGYLFEGIHLDLHIGETIAITGASGAGKSPLAWMLTGLIRPDIGGVYANGIPLDMIRGQQFRKQCALLPQRSQLISGRLYENITGFNTRDNLKDAIALSVTLGLEKFFASRPDGLGMRVGEAGETGLPSAVVDRIILVRGLVGAPKLIVFDEANLSLDAESDQRLLDYFKSIQSAVMLVLVTHRPSYLALAHRTYHLENGEIHRVVKEGTDVA